LRTSHSEKKRKAKGKRGRGKPRPACEHRDRQGKVHTRPNSTKEPHFCTEISKKGKKKRDGGGLFTTAPKSGAGGKVMYIELYSGFQEPKLRGRRKSQVKAKLSWEPFGA